MKTRAEMLKHLECNVCDITVRAAGEKMTFSATRLGIVDLRSGQDEHEFMRSDSLDAHDSNDPNAIAVWDLSSKCVRIILVNSVDEFRPRCKECVRCRKTKLLPEFARKAHCRKHRRWEEVCIECMLDNKNFKQGLKKIKIWPGETPCTGCGEVKPNREFGERADGKLWSRRCKTCSNIQYDDWWKPLPVEVQKDEGGDVDQQADDIDQQVIDGVRGLKPEKVENLMKPLFENVGLTDFIVTRLNNDGGIDFTCTGKTEVGTPVEYVGQVKRLQRNVRRKDIDELHGIACRKGKKAIFVSVSDFTKGAREAIEEIGPDKMITYNGKKLVELLKEYKIGVESRLVFVGFDDVLKD